MHRAAVDLGSNSFHLLVARMDGGRPEVVLHLRETVRLAGGMDADGRLAPDAQARALDCLRGFAARLGEFGPESVRVVGTNTLRVARDADAFLAEAGRVLGHPVEVITGREEARLIHLGVMQELEPAPGEVLLVLDIGGGSTEIVIGGDAELSVCESVPLGCVGLSERHFPGGVLSQVGMDAARAEARRALHALAGRCLAAGWDRAIATSGTAHAVREVLGADTGAVTMSELAALCARLAGASHVNEVELNGLAEDRKPILPGGAAILVECCALLGLDEIAVAEQALRNGLLHEAIHEPVIELTS